MLPFFGGLKDKYVELVNNLKSWLQDNYLKILDLKTVF